VDLRQEIVEAHKARVDFFKWKLILVAGLAATASGLIGTASSLARLTMFTQPGYVLTLIPLLCLYVDTLSLDQTLRVVVISRYLQLLHLQNRRSEDAEYEIFVSTATAMERVKFREIVTEIAADWWPNKEHRFISAYGFYSWAQYLSTIIFTVGVLPFGASLKLTDLERRVLWSSAIISLLCLMWMYLAYKRRFLGVRNLRDLGKVRDPRQ
jgi:hypothetical protein